MTGGGVDIKRLTELSNTYIKYLFHHYNETGEWAIEDSSIRRDMLEQYNGDIEEHKKALKRFFGSRFQGPTEIFTDDSINYVAKIDNLFDAFKGRNTVPGEAVLNDVILTEDIVRTLFDPMGGLNKNRKNNKNTKRRKKKKKKRVTTKKGSKKNGTKKKGTKKKGTK